MAGRPKTSGKLDQLVAERDEARKEVSRLRQLLATINPALLDTKALAPPFGEVTEENVDDFCERLLTMASEGMMENEWISALGFTEDEWQGVLVGFPKAQHAAARARVRVRAFLESTIRQAVVNRDNKFAAGAMRELQNIITATAGQQKGATGDASPLVRVAS